jgi:hypothetical protein
VRVSIPRKQRSHPTGSRYGSFSPHGDEFLLQPANPFLQMLDRLQVVTEDGAIRLVLEAQGAKPVAVRLGPRLTAVHKPSAKQHLTEPVSRAEQIFTRIFAAAAEIAHRLLFGRRRVNLRQSVGAQRLRELPRVAAVGLDPFTGLHRNQRWSDRDRVHARRSKLALQREPHGPAS